MASKTVIRPIAVLQVQFAIISHLTERNINTVNYYLGMKDMLRDIDARSCNICNYCNMANLAEPFLDS